MAATTMILIQYRVFDVRPLGPTRGWVNPTSTKSEEKRNSSLRPITDISNVLQVRSKKLGDCKKKYRPKSEPCYSMCYLMENSRTRLQLIFHCLRKSLLAKSANPDDDSDYTTSSVWPIFAYSTDMIYEWCPSKNVSQKKLKLSIHFPFQSNYRDF